MSLASEQELLEVIRSNKWSMAKKLIFAEDTPLGHRVLLTRDRWREILRFKHPALRGREADIRECVRNPDMIRESAKDSSVHLYYISVSTGHVCVVVGGDDSRARFVITAYLTKKLKPGNELWKK